MGGVGWVGGWVGGWVNEGGGRECEPPAAPLPKGVWMFLSSLLRCVYEVGGWVVEVTQDDCHRSFCLSVPSHVRVWWVGGWVGDLTFLRKKHTKQH